MNREIKFRAWDKKNNCWLTDKDNVYLSEEGEAFLLVRGAASDYLSRVDVDVVFWTGLLDKNGKEIYEGDIVKEVYVPIGSYPDVVEYYKEGVIVWGYKSFGVELKIEGTTVLDESRKLSYHRTERKVYKHPTQGEDWVDNHTSFHRLEIIGNIYENPELLK